MSDTGIRFDNQGRIVTQVPEWLRVLSNHDCTQAGYAGLAELDRRMIEAQKKLKRLDTPQLCALLIARTVEIHDADVEKRALRCEIIDRLDP